MKSYIISQELYKELVNYFGTELSLIIRQKLVGEFFRFPIRWDNRVELVNKLLWIYINE